MNECDEAALRLSETKLYSYLLNTLGNSVLSCFKLPFSLCGFCLLLFNPSEACRVSRITLL